jgi:hypothetical protein
MRSVGIPISSALRRLAILGGGLQGEAGLRAGDEEIEEAEREQAAEARDDLRLTEKYAADLDAALDHGIGDAAEIRRPQKLRQRAQEHREAEGGAYLRQHGRAEDVADDAVVGGDTHEEEQRRAQGHRVQGVEAEQRPQPERRVHADHHELAVGEVDDLHEPEDEAQPRRDEGVNEPHQQPADDGLNDDFPGHLEAPPASGDRARAPDEPSVYLSNRRGSRAVPRHGPW